MSKTLDFSPEYVTIIDIVYRDTKMRRISTMTGLIHIYCGDGKGKTTAAVGLAVRCAGGGGRVLFYQFLKGNDSGEREILSEIKNVELMKGHENSKFVWNMTKSEKEESRAYYRSKFEEITGKVKSEKYNMLIMDELIPALKYEFVDMEILMDFLKNKPQNLEVVMTGREPAAELVKIADYVSEVKKIKHPFDKGIAGRKMIES